MDKKQAEDRMHRVGQAPIIVDISSKEEIDKLIQKVKDKDRILKNVKS